MLPAVPVWDTVLWFSHNHLPALCLGQSRRSIIKSWLFSMNGKISIIKLPCNFLAGYQLVRWLKVDQPQIAVEYLGKDECLTCTRTTNIDLDSHNHFDPLPFGGETHASSFQTYFYHGWNGDIQPTQCVAIKCALITQPGAQHVSSSDGFLAWILGKL